MAEMAKNAVDMVSDTAIAAKDVVMQGAGMVKDTAISAKDVAVQGAGMVKDTAISAKDVAVQGAGMVKDTAISAKDVAVQGAGLVKTTAISAKDAAMQGAGMVKDTAISAKDVVMQGAGIAKDTAISAKDMVMQGAGATKDTAILAKDEAMQEAGMVRDTAISARDVAMQGAGRVEETAFSAKDAVEDAMEDAAVKLDSGPHLESLDRVCHMPVVSSAIEMTGSTYAYVKESSDLLNWALNYVESGLQFASATAAPIATPIVKKLEGPINAVDQTLCKGLDMVGQTVTTAKEQPQHIADAAKAVMNSSVTPALEKLTAVKDSATEKASSLKDSALAKADELLNTQFGNMAIQGVDSGSAAVTRLLDRYFPPVAGAEDIVPAPISPEENKVLHTVQTVGQLSTKTARRVYHSIAAQLKTVKKEDVTAYMNSVVSILHLTKLLGSEKENEAAASPGVEKRDDEIEIKEKMIIS